jgi:holo-[acyl-carrier protein] synthase
LISTKPFGYACYVILGTGVDLCEVPRIKASFERFGRRFLERIFTEREIAYCESKANKFERFAARFAAKEAGMKALGTGWRGVAWKEFEVGNLPSGRPTLRLHGNAEKIARQMGVANVALSITHTEEQSLAIVIFES